MPRLMCPQGAGAAGMVHRVFWADDSPADQVLIRVAVMELAMPVKVAAFDWGSTLLTQLETKTPSLVVLDVGMPGMDGVETLRRIRASGNDVPVVMFSTARIPEEVRACEQLGIEGFYVKPAQFTDYMEIVRRILARVVEPRGRGSVSPA
jgi:DNA-binding NarL/FixJ family response regulator